MGVAVNIISAVLKSVVGDKIGNELANELIGISIDEASEKGIDKISDFINGEKSKIERILSKENMKSMGIPKESIDYVVEEIKDLFTRINITDEVFRQYGYDSMNLSVFLWDKYRQDKSGYIECENSIKCCLFKIAQVLIELLRESEDFEKDFLIQISNSVDNAHIELQKISEYLNNNFGKLSSDNQAILEVLQMVLEQKQEDNEKNKSKKQQVKSRTQEYADKWNKNMFLNDFDEWDENAGVNVKLSDVYIDGHLPHFTWGSNRSESTNLKRFLSKYIYEKDENNMLLILGQPGIGKSTLITWITANFTDKLDDILVYRFASDLRDFDWQSAGVSYRILEKLGFEYKDLHSKTIILDGLDEVSIDDRIAVLDALYDNLIYENRIKEFTLIITCRENYVQERDRIKGTYIILQPWDEDQIRSFWNVFQKKTGGNISESTIKKIIESRDILGIPLILYIVLALNLSIEKEGSIVDIYDKIFSLNGGIYDRCIDNKNFADKHRIGELKEQIHQVSRDIAIWMFENNPVGAFIPKEEYQIICDNVMQKREHKNEDIQDDFLIGNYFKLVRHCEGIGTEELYFVHRSIYEYFVAETIYSSIENAMMELTEESHKELASKIVIYLKQGLITNTISEFLQYKFINLYNELSNEKKECFYLWWETAVEKMVEHGMFYYCNNMHICENVIEKETQCFVNLIKILRLIFDTGKRKYILEDVEINQLEKYIRLRMMDCRIGLINGVETLNLSKTYLVDINLSGMDFGLINLQGANLSGANLTRADFRETNLREVFFNGANLEEAIFTERQVVSLERDYNMQGTRVEVKGMNKLLNYEEFRENSI